MRCHYIHVIRRCTSEVFAVEIELGWWVNLCMLVFTGDELRDRLMPTWTAIYQMYPHSMPFRQPVDPVLEQIPVTMLRRMVL